MQGKSRDHRSTTLVDVGLVLNQYLFTGTMSKCGVRRHCMKSARSSILPWIPRQFHLQRSSISSSTWRSAPARTGRPWPRPPPLTLRTRCCRTPRTFSSSCGTGRATPTRMRRCASALRYSSLRSFCARLVGHVRRGALSAAGHRCFTRALSSLQLANYMNVRRRCSPYFSDFAPGSTPLETLRALLAYLTPPWPVLGAFVGEIGFALVVSEIPGAQELFGTGAVGGRYWGVAIGFALMVFTVSEAGKWWLHFHPESRVRALFWK